MQLKEIKSNIGAKFIFVTDLTNKLLAKPPIYIVTKSVNDLVCFTNLHNGGNTSCNKDNSIMESKIKLQA